MACGNETLAAAKGGNVYKVGNFFQNDDVDVIAQLGPFSVIQWKRDLSVDGMNAQQVWFAEQMNVRRRQVV